MSSVIERCIMLAPDSRVSDLSDELILPDMCSRVCPPRDTAPSSSARSMPTLTCIRVVKGRRYQYQLHRQGRPSVNVNLMKVPSKRKDQCNKYFGVSFA